jgi:hypothetical protein
MGRSGAEIADNVPGIVQGGGPGRLAGIRRNAQVSDGIEHLSPRVLRRGKYCKCSKRSQNAAPHEMLPLRKMYPGIGFLADAVNSLASRGAASELATTDNPAGVGMEHHGVW